MWKLKPGMDEQEYHERKREIEAERGSDLFRIRERFEGDLRGLFVEYHEEVPGEKSNEPTYPLRGGAEWKGEKC